MRRLFLFATLVLALALAWACKPFDDDLAYVPNYVCDYLMYETDSGTVLSQYDVYGLDSTYFELNQISAVEIHPLEPTLGLIVTSPPAFVIRHLDQGNYNNKVFKLPCIGNQICFGRKNALVITSLPNCKTLTFFNIHNRQYDNEGFTIRLNYMPLEVVFRQGRFYVASDSVLYVYSDDATALIDSLPFQHSFLDMSLVPGFAISILGQTDSNQYVQSYDANSFQFRSAASTKLVRQEYSTLLKSQFEMEFLGYVGINNLGILEVKPNNLQPFPVLAYNGQASSFSLDYIGARLFFLRADSLFVNEFKSGNIRLIATGVRNFSNSATYYQIGN